MTIFGTCQLGNLPWSNAVRSLVHYNYLQHDFPGQAKYVLKYLMQEEISLFRFSNTLDSSDIRK